MDRKRFELLHLSRSDGIAIGFDHRVRSIGLKRERMNHGRRRVRGSAVESAYVNVPVERPGGQQRGIPADRDRGFRVPVQRDALVAFPRNFAERHIWAE